MVYNLTCRLSALCCEPLANRPLMYCTQGHASYCSAQCNFWIGLVCLRIGICFISELRKVLQMCWIMVIQYNGRCGEIGWSIRHSTWNWCRNSLLLLTCKKRRRDDISSRRMSCATGIKSCWRRTPPKSWPEWWIFWWLCPSRVWRCTISQ